MAAKRPDLYAFFEVHPGGAFKIGRTDNVSRRLAQVQTGNSSEVALGFSAPGLGWMERALHRAFRDEHMRGEWFTAEGAVQHFVSYIQDRFAGRPTRAVEVLEALLVALHAAEANRSRELWDRMRYALASAEIDEAARAHERVADRLRYMAESIRREAAERHARVAEGQS